MSRAGVTAEVAVDWTKCFAYERLVTEEVGHYSTIEVTEDLKQGGIDANRAWERWYRFLTAAWRTDFVAEIVGAARRFAAPRLLSLGCGYGGMEIECARRLGGRYELLALDLNEDLFGRARDEAAREGLHVQLQALDLNFVELAESSFDVVFAHASLHHLLNFEHLFAQVHRALRPDGRFVVLDIIGKTQVLFWPENVRFAAELVAKMPERYRAGLATEPGALFPGYLEGAEQQGMEGIRQGELEEQIERFFRPLSAFKYNSFVRLICTHPTIAPRFDPDLAEDRDYLDSLFRLDLEQVRSEALRPTEMFAVYEKRTREELASRGAGDAVELRSEPLVSVCVAVDGPAGALRTCMASLLAQTHRRLEILLVLAADDGEAADVARELAGRHPKVRLLPPVSVVGDGRADWARALPVAAGEYVACLSSRDAWYPVKLAEQVAFLEAQPAVGLAFAQAVVVDDRGRRTARAFGTDLVGEDISRHALERLIEGGEIPRSTAVFRRACWRQSAPADGAVVTEEEIWLRLAARWEVGFQDRPLGMLRAPAEAAREDDGLRRERQLAALERLRRDVGRRMSEPRIRAALDRRLAELGGSASAERVDSPREAAGPGRLRRFARWLAGRA
ncbi:MAG TPA: methyltransferase domain-containing protein [Solirubrobacterales bacterium]|nr:methyltransferase domain-containing protein [Solirubrobacterales bacterium]